MSDVTALDELLEAFVDQCCETVRGHRPKGRELYDAFVHWRAAWAAPDGQQRPRTTSTCSTSISVLIY